MGNKRRENFPRSQIFRQGLLPISLIAFLKVGLEPHAPATDLQRPEVFRDTPLHHS